MARVKLLVWKCHWFEVFSEGKQLLAKQLSGMYVQYVE